MAKDAVATLLSSLTVLVKLKTLPSLTRLLAGTAAGPDQKPVHMSRSGRVKIQPASVRIEEALGEKAPYNGRN